MAPTAPPLSPSLAAIPGVPDWFGIPDWVWVVGSYVGTVVLTIAIYETIRYTVVSRLRKRLERDVTRFLRSQDLYAQSFKFTSKLVVRELLMADPEVQKKILEHAEEHDLAVPDVQKKVETYIDEIVPEFRVLSYFKVGYSVARAFIHSVYDPVVDRERRKVLESLPADASPVYVMNHRSNVDFVLLAYILAGRVSISYAVGEWARIWPLEKLFKSFGSYFVRRGYKEELYHKVLERYVQLQAKHGVVQAIFPEGRLTRDGRLLDPKLGLVTWLSRLEHDPEFHRRLVFVPVGVNYDWVLEDDDLVAEAKGKAEPEGLAKRLFVAVAAPFVGLGLIAVNGARFLVGRRKLHGYAGLSFGEPVYLDEWARDQGIDLSTTDPTTRRDAVTALGDTIMDRIGRAVPATPATLVSVAMLDDPQDRYEETALVVATMRVRAELEEKGVPVVVGRAFQKFRHALAVLEEDERLSAAKDRPAELDDMTRTIHAQEEAEALVRFALDVLRRNRILRRKGRTWRVRKGMEDHVRYYANSLAHHLGREWAIGTPSADLPGTPAPTFASDGPSTEDDAPRPSRTG